MARTSTYSSLRNAPERIILTSTDIGDIAIEPSIDNERVFFQLNDIVIPYTVYETNKLHGTYMEFVGNIIITQPRTDVMYVLSNMPNDDITNLVAQLFGIEVPLKGLAYTLRPNLYRIVA